jgi:hypothetical protein
MTLDDLIQYHSDNCMKLKYGDCRTLRCLKLGDYRKNLVIDSAISTCEENETVYWLNYLKSLATRKNYD